MFHTNQGSAEEIRRIRENLNMSIKEFSKATGICVPQLYGYEKGHHAPRPRNLEKIFILAKSNGIQGPSDRPLIASQPQTNGRRFSGRNLKLTLWQINKILAERGITPLSRQDLAPAKEIDITRRQIKQMKRQIEQHGFAVLRRLKKNPAKCEFVHPQYVRITQARYGEGATTPTFSNGRTVLHDKQEDQR